MISMEHAKAAALRAMLPWVALRAAERAQQSGGSRAAQLRAQLLQGLAAMDAVWREHGRFLPRHAEREAQARCLEAMQALAELQSLFPDGPWRLQPKAHALMHLACDAVGTNPRWTHCYQDEDFIGRTKSLYTSCHGRTAARRAVQRYALGQALQLTCREQLHVGLRSPKAAALRGGPLQARAVSRGPGPSSSNAAASPSSAALQTSSPRFKRGRGRPPKQLAKRPRGRPRKAGGAAGV